MKGIGYLILAGIVAVMVIPVLFTPFSLIDDPQMYEKYLAVSSAAKAGRVTEAVRNIWTTFPGINEGRLAVLSWAWWVIQFALAGDNPLVHYGLNTGLILASGLVFYKVIQELSGSKRAAEWSFMVWLLSFWGYENWMRLSTQEPLQALMVLGLVLMTLKSGNTALTAGFSLAAILSKESSILLTPFFWGWWVVDKDNRKKVLKTAAVFSIVSIIFLVYWKFFINPGRWTEGNASWEHIIPSLGVYLKIINRLGIGPAVAVVLSWWLIFRNYKNQHKVLKAAVVMGGLAIAALVSLLPWKFALERYLWLFGFGVAGMLGMILAAMTERWPKRGVELAVVMIAAVVIGRYGFMQITERVKFTSHHLAREGANWQMLKWVATLPSESRVVVNVSRNHFDAQEWVLQINKAERLFFKREDIRVGFIDGQDQDYGYVLDWSMYRNDKLPQGLRVFNSEYQATAPTQSLRMWAKFLLSGNKELILIKNSYWWKAYEVPERRETSQM